MNATALTLTVLVLGALLVGVAGCGDATSSASPASPSGAQPEPSQPFTGTFQGGVNGARCVLTLRQDGDRVTGTFDKVPVAASVANGVASGPLIDPETNAHAGTFELTPSGDGLVVRVTLKDLSTGATESASVPFTRQTATHTTRQAATLSGERDDRLVGTWLWTETFVSNGTTLVIDHWLELQADGTCSRHSRGAGGSERIGIDLPDTQRTHGHWRTEDKVLYTSTSPDADPERLARYLCDGAHLMLIYNNGDKEVWERQ